MVNWLDDPQAATLVASRANFGLIGALMVVALKVGGDVRTILVWLGINVFITFTIPGISWQGHIGGLLGGIAIAAILAFAPRARRAQVQWLGLAALAVVLLVLVAVRTLALA